MTGQAAPAASARHKSEATDAAQPAMSGKKRLLVLLRDEAQRPVIAYALRDFELDAVTSFEEMDDAFRRRRHDLALLDVTSRIRDRALDAIRSWRSAASVMPIIVVSDLPRSLTAGCLSAGADVSLRKPYHLSELTSQIRSLLSRRAAASEPARVDGVLIGIEPVRFAQANMIGRTLEFPSGSEQLLLKLYAILRYLADCTGQFVQREDLARAIWPKKTDVSSHHIDVYFHKLRFLFRKHGIDLSKFVVAERKLGWRVHSNARS